MGAAFLLLGCVFLFFHESILTGRTPMALGNTYDWEPWASHAGRARPPSNPFLVDAWNVFVPWHLHTRDQLRRGEIPWWNPHVECGVPHAANDQTAVFFPLTWLYVVLPIPSAFLVRILIESYVAAIGTYAVVYRLTGRCQAGVLAGVLYSLGGFLITYLNFPLHSTAALLPALLYAAERALSTPGTGRTLALGWLGGMTLLSGHLQTAAHIGCFLGLYILVRVACLFRAGLRPSLRAFPPFLWAILLAGLLAAPQLAAVGEYVSHSAGLRRREAAVIEEEEPGVRTGRTHLAHAALFLLPDLFGRPAGDVYLRPAGSRPLTELLQVFVGPLALFLAGLGAWRHRRSPIPVFLTIICLISFLSTSAFPVLLGLTRRIPLLNLTSVRTSLFFSFCASVLAGYGLAALPSVLSSGKSFARLSAGLAILGLVAVAGIQAVVRPLFLERGFDYVHGSYEHASEEMKAAYPLDARERKVERAFANLRNAVAVPAALFGVWVLVLRRVSQERLRAWLLPVTLVAAGGHLWWVERDWNPPIEWPAEGDLPATPEIGFLRGAGEGRIYGRKVAFLGNTPLAFGFYSVKGHDALGVYRYKRLMTVAGDGEGDFFSAPIFLDAERHPVLDLAGARWIVSTEPIEGAGYRLADESFPVFVYENPRALPRTFLAGRTSVLRDADAVLERMAAPDFDPREAALLETDGPSFDGPGGGACRIVREENHLVEIEVEAEGESLLVLTDTYYPGWRVRVDGREERIVPAYHAFRGVAVGPGSHRVEFRYAPWWLGPAMAAHALGWLLVVGGGLILLAHRTRARG